MCPVFLPMVGSMICRILCACFFLTSLGPAHPATPGELTQLQQENAFLVTERVTIPYDRGVEALNAKFAAALTQAGEAAQKAGHLPEVLALDEEKKRLAAGQALPEKDEASTAESLKRMRAVYREQLKLLQQQRDTAHMAVGISYIAKLKALEVTLTKAGRLDEAREVLTLREGLGKGTAIADLSPPAPRAPVTNSLGMKFVKVPGTGVFFCLHETRRQDYAAYAARSRGVDDSWKNRKVEGVPVGDKDNHPVVGVNWHDAQAFCVWLSKKEGKRYRLPTDKEWSHAVGVGSQESWTPEATPETLNEKMVEHYPWNGTFPPKDRDAGNYADSSFKEKYPGGAVIPGFTDGFATTAPVMSCKASPLGLFDLGGNVWEWCQDWYNNSKQQVVMRGGGYDSFNSLHSSFRMRDAPHFRHNSVGFRVVMEE